MIITCREIYQPYKTARFTKPPDCLPAPIQWNGGIVPVKPKEQPGTMRVAALYDI